MRALLVRLHRWAGLAVAAFLILVGLTGALLAFYPELSHALSPELFPGLRAGKELPLRELARIAEEIVPGAQVSSVFVGYSGTAMISLDAAPGAPALAFTRIYLDTVSGRELGRMNWGAFPTSAAMIMPFIYTLHYSLALGEIGVWVMGIVAVVWTVDCFVSFFVTLPPPGAHARKGFLARWTTAWRIKFGSSFYRLNFDIHRAGGLWLWAMLFVFAWSSVYWNMTGLYVRVTDALFDFKPPQWAQPAPEPTSSGAQTPMGWRDAQAVADRLMSDQSRQYGFSVARPVGFNLMRDHGTYSYDALSSLDIAEKYGATSIVFDAHSGALVDMVLPDRAARWKYDHRLAVRTAHGGHIRAAVQNLRFILRMFRRRACRHGRLHLVEETVCPPRHASLKRLLRLLFRKVAGTISFQWQYYAATSGAASNAFVKMRAARGSLRAARVFSRQYLPGDTIFALSVCTGSVPPGGSLSSAVSMPRISF